jgi:hypothetical protein
MIASGKVRVIVRSRKVPVSTTVLQHPSYSQSGVLIGSEPHRVVLYEDRFDPEHLEAIENGRKLSGDLGLGFEVVDLSRSSRLRRAALGFLAGGSPITLVTGPGVEGAGRAISGTVTSSAEQANLSSNP